MSGPIKAANFTSGHCTPANVLTMSGNLIRARTCESWSVRGAS